MGLMRTGLGQYGGYINPYVSAWDALPGEIFIRALGGKVTDFSGNAINYDQPEGKRVSMIASLDNGIHAEMLAIVKEHYGK
jgi:fructose-1,6-bisphosphatase/inositol monophosphatase family enzyme